MLRSQLVSEIYKKQSYLCVGLDTDMDKIPAHLKNRPNALLNFNKSIIDATKNYCVSYKVNTAFFEVLGSKGWDIMQETFDYIPSTHLKIADAKRGDIGNTSHQYAKAFFEEMKVDAITVAPYMGEDSIRPFLEYDSKWTIVLGLTSNLGSNDFQQLKLADGSALYAKVLKTIATWGSPENLMFVTGATRADAFSHIRKLVPEHFLLVPGVGAQGGSLQDVSKYGFNKECGLLVNASRAVIYASGGEDFAEAAALVSKNYCEEMAIYLQQ
ncbi:MAG: orotidine-5'-phosphate decarboxylase [Bacteroidota bacterium]